jgi:hypothetical protein
MNDRLPSLFIDRFSNSARSRLTGGKSVWERPVDCAEALLEDVGWGEFSILSNSCKSISLSSKELPSVGESAMAPAAAGLVSRIISLWVMENSAYSTSFSPIKRSMKTHKSDVKILIRRNLQISMNFREFGFKELPEGMNYRLFRLLR